MLCVCVCCTPSSYSEYSVLCPPLSVSDASGDHTVETHSSMGPAMALYVTMIIYPCCPHAVDVSALSIRTALRASAVVISICLLYVSLGSRVSPSILGLMSTGTVMLSTCSSSCVLYSSGSGVKRAHAVLSGLRMRRIVFDIYKEMFLLIITKICL